MNRIMISPSRYVQGNGAIADLGKYLALLGKNALVIGGSRGLQAVETALKQSCQESNVAFCLELFNGECCRQEIDRLVSVAQDKQADMIVGVGGGKALDVAKAVAHYAKLPVAIAPTVAATDAPCSSLSVIYTPNGEFETYIIFPKNPDLVLLDTGIVAKAPVRLFVSGMGDALATWFEADACAKSGAANIPGGLSTAAALCLARLCFDTLLEHGFRAKLAVENKVVTEDVEKIAEANTLLSGLGFESSGLAAAHAIHNGLTVLPETHAMYHGEKVAFGTLVQTILENRSAAEIEQVIRFCMQVGLPTTLEQIGVKDASEEKLRRVAEAACNKTETIHNEPFVVTPESVYAAIVTADALGKYHQN